MTHKFEVKGWTDKKGRSASSFQELALRRAQESNSIFWRVKPHSWVPVWLQVLAWRIILWIRPKI